MDSKASKLARSESSILDEVFQGQEDPFLSLISSDEEDIQLRIQYPVHPKKKRVYPFTQFILYSIENPGGPAEWEHYVCSFIVFATKIGLIGIPLAVAFHLDNTANTIDSTLLKNAKIPLPENQGVYVYQTTHGAGPIIDWNSVVKEFSEKYSIFLTSPEDNNIAMGNYNTAWMTKILDYGTVHFNSTGTYGFQYPNMIDKIRSHIAYLQSIYMDRTNPSIPIIEMDIPPPIVPTPIKLNNMEIITGASVGGLGTVPPAEPREFVKEPGYRSVVINSWFVNIPYYTKVNPLFTNYLWQRIQGARMQFLVLDNMKGSMKYFRILWPLYGMTEYQGAMPITAAMSEIIRLYNEIDQKDMSDGGLLPLKRMDDLPIDVQNYIMALDKTLAMSLSEVKTMLERWGYQLRGANASGKTDDDEPPSIQQITI